MDTEKDKVYCFRYFGFFILFLANVLFLNCSRSIIIDYQPFYLSKIEGLSQERAKSIQDTISNAGENSVELINAITLCPKEYLPGMLFIIETMPFPDYAIIKAEFLLNDVKLAYQTKHQFPWGKKIPDDVFFRYILPYRIAEEHIEDWRPYLNKQLTPIVSDLTNMSDVAHQINLWLGSSYDEKNKRVHFKPTERRDQGVLETLNRGYGRCEEMMISYIASARSVCIPARSVWTPWWPITNNNHAWVEVWIDGKWYNLGGAEPHKKGIEGGGWFTPVASRAAVVLTSTFGKIDSPETYKANDKNSFLNVIENYSVPCEVSVMVTNENGPVENAKVYISLYNWGRLRPFEYLKTNPIGQADFKTGIGSYMVFAMKDDKITYEFIQTKFDKEKICVNLDLSKTSIPNGFFFFSYPSLYEAKEQFNKFWLKHGVDRTLPSLSPKILQHCRLAEDEEYIYKEFKKEDFPELIKKIKNSPFYTSVISSLKEAGGNCPELIEGILKTNKNNLDDMLWQISHLKPVEGLEVSSQILLDNLKYSTLVKNKTNNPKLYQPFVLNFTYPNIHITNWRKYLYKYFESILEDFPTQKGNYNPLPVIKQINDWVSQNITIKEQTGRYSQTASPNAVLNAKAGSPYEIAVFTSAALRVCGVPSKVNNDWVEFYYNNQWLPLYPMDPKNIMNKQKDEKAKKTYEIGGSLKVVTFINGKEINNDEDIRLYKYKFADRNEELSPENGFIYAQEGNYLLTIGNRTSNGDVLVYAKPITIQKQKGVEVDVEMSIPPECITPTKSLFEVQSDKEVFYNTLSKLTSTSLDELKNNILLVCVFNENAEPSVRMKNILSKKINDLQNENVKILLLRFVEENRKEDENNKGIYNITLTDLNMLFKTELENPFLSNSVFPITALISASEDTLFLQNGYNLNFVDAIFNVISARDPQNILSLNAPNRVSIKEVPYSDFIRCYKIGVNALLSSDYKSAIDLFEKALKDSPENNAILYDLACAYALNGKTQKALNALDLALKCGYDNYDWIYKDPDLSSIRITERFKKLMDLYKK